MHAVVFVCHGRMRSFFIKTQMFTVHRHLAHADDMTIMTCSDDAVMHMHACSRVVGVVGACQIFGML